MAASGATVELVDSGVKGRVTAAVSRPALAVSLAAIRPTATPLGRARTVTASVAVFPSALARSVVAPGLSARTFPGPDTLATEGLSEVQANE